MCVRDARALFLKRRSVLKEENRIDHLFKRIVPCKSINFFWENGLPRISVKVKLLISETHRANRRLYFHQYLSVSW